MLLKNCRFIVTQDEERTILENQDILLADDRIKKIGKDLDQEGHEVIDCSEKIVMPGLINVHGHATMNFLRGVCDDEELHTWLSIIKPKEEAATEKAQQESAMNAIKEMIASGTTTFCEGYNPIGPMFDVVKQAGIRCVLFADLDEAKQLTDEFHKHPLISFGTSAHSIYLSTEEQLKQVHEFAQQHDIIKTLHIAETRKERFDCMNKNGCLPIQYLEKIGWLDEKTLLAHAVWITKGEIRILKKHEVKVAHNPVSNMKLASGGVMPLPEMDQEGVVVGLGTDSVASNNNLDLFEEMKVTGLLHKHHRWDPKTAPVQKILDMATREGARCLHLQDKVGTIEPGKQADLITIDLTHPKMQQTTKENILSTIIYTANGNDVIDTIIAGKVMMKYKKLEFA